MSPVAKLLTAMLLAILLVAGLIAIFAHTSLAQTPPPDGHEAEVLPPYDDSPPVPTSTPSERVEPPARGHGIGPEVPFLTISPWAGTTSVTEGEQVTFTIRSSFAPTETILINVGTVETGNYIDHERLSVPSQITLDARTSTTYLIYYTKDDSVNEPDGSIQGQILPGNDYLPGQPSSATITVRDNDDPSPTATATPPPLSLPPAPSGLKVTQAKHDRVTLSWNRLEGASTYRIRHRPVGGRWIYHGESSANPKAITNLTTGRDYQFAVQARGNGETYRAGLGSWSSPVDGSTPEVFLSGLPSELEIGATDGFTVYADNLNRHLDHALSVWADSKAGVSGQSDDEPNAGVAQTSSTCSSKVARTNIDSNRTFYIWDVELIGCAKGTASLTAYLLDRTGFPEDDPTN